MGALGFVRLRWGSTPRSFYRRVRVRVRVRASDLGLGLGLQA